MALIDDVIWEAGPEAVAEEIEKIRARFDAEQAAKAVAEHLASSPVAMVDAQPAPSMIGHNQPPEALDIPLDPPEVDRLMVHVQTFLQQMPAETMDIAKVELATKEIEKTENKLREGLARRLGLSADEFAKQFGKHGATAAWGAVGAGTLWALGLLGQLGPLLRALWNVLKTTVGI